MLDHGDDFNRVRSFSLLSPCARGPILRGVSLLFPCCCPAVRGQGGDKRRFGRLDAAVVRLSRRRSRFTLSPTDC